MRQYAFFYNAVLFLTIIHSVTSGLFDASELELVKYEIELETRPSGFPSDKELSHLNVDNEDTLKNIVLDKLPDVSDPSYVFLTSKSGQKFACKIPERPKPVTAPPPDSLNPKYVAEIVSAAFYVKDCVSKNTGWWMYELCRGKTITQFHSSKGKSDYAEYSLGMFTGKFAMPDYAQSTKERPLYLEEEYVGGSMCDVFGKQTPRKTTVRYECDPGLETSEAYILSVSEVASCEYLIIVRVGSICKLPQFVVPSELLTPSLIECRPFVGRERAIEHARRLHQKELRKKEAKAVLESKLSILESVNRRRSVFKRTKLDRDPRRNRELSRRIDSDLAAAKQEYLTTMHIAKEGVSPSEETLNALKKLGKFSKDLDLYTDDDYPTYEDMDRGYFYFYMTDRRWPKDEYPRALFYVDLLNAYHEKAEKLASRARPFDQLADTIRARARKDPWVEENNVVVTADSILKQLDEYFPSWYARDANDYQRLIQTPIYQNEVVDAFVESLYDEFKKGTELAKDRESLIREITRNLAPLMATLKMKVYEQVFPRVLTSFVDLIEKLVIATEYAQMSFEIQSPMHTLSFKGKFADQEKSLAVSGYWNEHYNRVIRNLEAEKRHAQREEYEKMIVEQATSCRATAFLDVWDKVAEELVAERRDRLDREDRFNILGGKTDGHAGVVVPFTVGDTEQLMQLISKAGLGDLEMKVQVVSLDGSKKSDSPEMRQLVNELMEETMNAIRSKQQAEKREKNYMIKIDDEL